jgi:SAM-dependent methyltransferase
MSPSTPVAQLERQFRNLAPTRRHIWSLLPLRRARIIVDSGCGTGLLARELLPLTDASVICIDRVERPGVPDGVEFIQGDAAKITPIADIYVSSFFLYQLINPIAYLKKVGKALSPGGFYAAAGEFCYRGSHSLVAALGDSLRSEGFDPLFGATMDETFVRAGFRIVASGTALPLWEPPNQEFLQAQLGALKPETMESLSVPVNWGVYRK